MNELDTALRALRDALDELTRQDPVTAMRGAARAETLAREAAQRAVAAACLNANASWADVGAAFGVSRQAAHQRFARQVRAARP
ncbi:hypothetical protein MF672_008155 [Actinomadura sp. ATCC 31491]|uniref:Helix-turn-helix domain-containing protein n=1 Tax=Actinomadura luzonensis TaxID=2805427 RepID=A0ABT0FN31_9ACTN|nr:hypothetical protein [Actinomadura luzonensis]MCK2213759.1 hypothetical protein [Actinomadura luzonensis]